MNSGLDPELLLVRDHFVIPAHFFLTGSRTALIAHDNAAAEFRPEPTQQTKRLVKRLRILFRNAFVMHKTAVLSRTLPLGTNFSLRPAAPLRECDRNHKEVARFGCSPASVLREDYSQEQVMPMVSADMTAYRSAGFHIHTELPADTSVECAVAVLDALLGLKDVLVNARLEVINDARMRRQTLGYGRAGEFRTRVVGGKTVLEYRVLSPWPFMAPSTVSYVVNLARAVCSQSEEALMDLLTRLPERRIIMKAINESMVPEAAELHLASWHTWVNHAARVNAKPVELRGPDVGDLNQLRHSLHSFSRNWINT